MRICMFSRIMPAHAPGGMQDHVLALSTGLVRRGHSVSVITSALPAGTEFESVEGVAVHYLKGTPPGQNTNSYWFGAASKLEELQAAAPFDLLHSQSVGAYGVYRRGLHRKYHLPLVTSFHGTHLDVLTTSWHTDFGITNPIGTARFFALALNLLFRYWYRDLWFTRGSDVVIATSDADVGKYKLLYRLPDSQIRKVYNGIDTDLFSPRADGEEELRSELRVGAGEKMILALARLEKDKGVQNVIEVMPQVRAACAARLVVVGDGEYRAALESLAAERGVAEFVQFVGAKTLDECARYFSACDLFVDPTLRTDGYDLTIAEAMACGKPVIASDVGANSTLIDAGAQSNGVLVRRGDNGELAREIVNLLNEPDRARAMGKKAREKIASRFSLDAMVEGMEQVYAEMIERFRPAGQAA